MASLFLPTPFPRTLSPCGSELARDSDLSANINIECYGPIASKLAPTFDQGCPHFL